MKICNIVPLKYSYLMYQQDMVMLLCHLSKNNDKYAKEAHDAKNYKIMDNSIIELGEAFTLEDLIIEARKCKANEIILPDVFQEGEATLSLVKDSINYLKNNHILGEFKLQAVCHGKTIDEFKSSFKALNMIKEIDVIGIPKVLTKIFGNRCSLYDIFKNTNKEIHLLGCWDSFNELKVLPDEAFKKIRSLDTCLISILSQKGDDVFNTNRPKKSIDFEKTKINITNYYKMVNQINNFIKENINN